MNHIRKAQFWSMDAIMAVTVFMVAFILVLGIIVELGDEDQTVELQSQGMTIQTALAADRSFSFIEGVTVDPKRLALFTTIPYDNLRETLGIRGDFCIYFEKADGTLISIPSTTGSASGVGDPRVFVDGKQCETEFGVCADLDGDGYGDGPDCIDADPDDEDEYVTPETVDDWCDGVDNDRDGSVDQDAIAFVTGPPPPSCGLDVGACRLGTYECLGSLGIQCTGGILPSPEVCDELDNDCDGTVDEDCSACFDNDGDGHDAASCGGDDCDDSNILVNPSQAELCGDSVDNNCDLRIDEDCVPACRDDDGDGFQDAVCDGTDCNDLNPSVNPGATEICDDDVDNDCDGDVDAADADCVSPPPCTANEVGLCTDGLDNDCDASTDCADSDCAADDACVSPPACTVDEVGFCNDGIDNDCDGRTDCGDTDCAEDTACAPPIDGPPPSVCTDADGDDYGEFGASTCPSVGVDCDDSNSGIYPGAMELCGDGIDQDCDGADLVVDVDGDGDYDIVFCTNGWDCDDLDADRGGNGAMRFWEWCDFKDNNCDGAIDNVLGPSC